MVAVVIVDHVDRPAVVVAVAVAALEAIRAVCHPRRGMVAAIVVAGVTLALAVAGIVMAAGVAALVAVMAAAMAVTPAAVIPAVAATVVVPVACGEGRRSAKGQHGGHRGDN